MVQYETLKTIAIRVGMFGGLATFIAINTIPYIYSEKIRKTEHYKQAMQLLRSHPEAVKYLGEPIKEGRVNTTKTQNFGADEETMWLRIPLIGSKDRGELFYDFTLKKQNEPVQLSRVELTLKSTKDYKLLIKKAD